MLKLSGQILKVKRESFQGKTQRVDVQKLEVLDIDGEYSTIRVVTDFDVKAEYKQGGKFESAVVVKAFMSKSGGVGMSYSVYRG